MKVLDNINHGDYNPFLNSVLLECTTGWPTNHMSKTGFMEYEPIVCYVIASLSASTCCTIATRSCILLGNKSSYYELKKKKNLENFNWGLHSFTRVNEKVHVACYNKKLLSVFVFLLEVFFFLWKQFLSIKWSYVWIMILILITKY